jgi:hypothetical protein
VRLLLRQLAGPSKEDMARMREQICMEMRSLNRKGAV